MGWLICIFFSFMERFYRIYVNERIVKTIKTKLSFIIVAAKVYTIKCLFLCLYNKGIQLGRLFECRHSIM